jgi:hypothetical protein
MKQIRIDLNAPIEKTLAAVLSLPEGGNPRSAEEHVVADALQCLYRAAHGPKIETSFGAISIAPAVDPSLKDASFLVETRSDLLTIAERRTPFKCRRKESAGVNHLAAGSALFEFIAGRLGSPECWPELDSKSLRTRRASSTHRKTNTGV